MMDRRERLDLDRYLTRSDEPVESDREDIIAQIAHGGWPDAPEIWPHSWLQSLIEWAEEIGPQIPMEDPAAFWEMLGEVRSLRSLLVDLAGAERTAPEPATSGENISDAHQPPRDQYGLEIKY